MQHVLQWFYMVHTKIIWYKGQTVQRREAISEGVKILKERGRKERETVGDIQKEKKRKIVHSKL